MNDDSNAAGASEAITEERENDLRIALRISWDDLEHSPKTRAAIQQVAMEWPGDIEAAIDAVDALVIDDNFGSES